MFNYKVPPFYGGIFISSSTHNLLWILMVPMKVIFSTLKHVPHPKPNECGENQSNPNGIINVLIAGRQMNSL